MQTNAEETPPVNQKKLHNINILVTSVNNQHTQFCSQHFLKEGWILETCTSIHEYYNGTQVVDQAVFRVAKHLSQLKPGNATVGSRRTHSALGHSTRGRGTR